jgi:hypothetical protein
MFSKALASEAAPLREHQLFFVEKKLALFSYINNVRPDEKLQGILAVITAGEHPAEYGLRSQLQLFNGLGITFADCVLLPKRPDYFWYSAHYHPVGNKDDRQYEKYEYYDNEQYALHIHNQITSSFYYPRQLLTSGTRKAIHPAKKTMLPMRPSRLLSVRLCAMKKMAQTRKSSQPAR